MYARRNPPKPPVDEDIEVTLTMNLAQAKILFGVVGNIGGHEYAAIRKKAYEPTKTFMPVEWENGQDVLAAAYDALKRVVNNH
jgi:hypothetical protein